MIGRHRQIAVGVTAVGAATLAAFVAVKFRQQRPGPSFTFEQATRVVADIPEVRAFMARNPTPMMTLDGAPTITNPVWTVYVGEDHPDHTVRWATFEVNAMTGEVRADDPTGERVPLSQWQWEQRLSFGD